MPTSKIVYLGGLRTEATHLQSNTSILTDAPTDNNGKGEAFSPTDLVATALGSCMMTIIGIFADRNNIDLTGTTLEITKTMSAEAPRRIAKVCVNLQVQSASVLDQDTKTKLKRIAHTCPVALSLHPDIEQDINFNFQ